MLWNILSAGLLTAAVAFAQGGGGGGWGHRNEDPSGGMQWHGPGQLDPFADKLKLSKEQRTETDAIVSAAREEMGPLQGKLLEARKNLAAALIGGQNGDAVDRMAHAYTAISAQIKAVEAKAFGKLCPLLKPNQQAKAVQNFGLLAQLIEQGQMGGGQWSGGQGQWSGGRGGRK